MLSSVAEVGDLFRRVGETFSRRERLFLLTPV